MFIFACKTTNTVDPITISLLAAGGSQLINWFQGLGARNHANRSAFRDFQHQQRLLAQQNAANMDLANQQRNWNENMWQKQNRYNAPAAQMARFKAAGLNPHLIYGQGNPGNAGAVQSYNRADVNSALDAMPRGQAIANYTGMMTANVQRSQMAVLQQDALFKAMETMNKAITGKRIKLDYETASKIQGTQIKAAKANLERLTTEITGNNLRNELQEKINPKQLKKIDAEIKKIVEEIRNTKAKTLTEEQIKRIKRLEYELKNQGLDTSGGFMSRILQLIFRQLRPDLKELIKF